MFKLSPLELRQSLTDAEFTLHLYKLPINSLSDLLEDFEDYGMRDDCKLIIKITIEKINNIVTRID
jgi:hypothetical protein